jgi:hypothetical protein
LSWLELLLIPLGFVVGAYGTLVGAGGGFVLVPVLLLTSERDAATHVDLARGRLLQRGLRIGGVRAMKRIDYHTGLIRRRGVPRIDRRAFLVGAVPPGVRSMFGAAGVGGY